jgi:hypothetical protein
MDARSDHPAKGRIDAFAFERTVTTSVVSHDRAASHDPRSQPDTPATNRFGAMRESLQRLPRVPGAHRTVTLMVQHPVAVLRSHLAADFIDDLPYGVRPVLEWCPDPQFFPGATGLITAESWPEVTPGSDGVLESPWPIAHDGGVVVVGNYQATWASYQRLCSGSLGGFQQRGGPFANCWHRCRRGKCSSPTRSSVFLTCPRTRRVFRRHHLSRVAVDNSSRLRSRCSTPLRRLPWCSRSEDAGVDHTSPRNLAAMARLPQVACGRAGDHRGAQCRACGSAQ